MYAIRSYYAGISVGIGVGPVGSLPGVLQEASTHSRAMLASRIKLCRSSIFSVSYSDPGGVQHGEADQHDPGPGVGAGVRNEQPMTNETPRHPGVEFHS